ncbi:MAG: hypothetical protein JO025_19715 [Verrucomicrobia bacterium]|nr:hypothetical protein [Verrucomicrobiota bacterium]
MGTPKEPQKETGRRNVLDRKNTSKETSGKEERAGGKHPARGLSDEIIDGETRDITIDPRKPT